MDTNLNQSFEVKIPYDSQHRELDLGYSIHHILQNSTPTITRITLHPTTSDFLLPSQIIPLRIRRTLPLSIPPPHRRRFYCRVSNHCQNQESPFLNLTKLAGQQTEDGGEVQEEAGESKDHPVGLIKGFRMEGVNS